MLQPSCESRGGEKSEFGLLQFSFDGGFFGFAKVRYICGFENLLHERLRHFNGRLVRPSAFARNPGTGALFNL